MLIVRIFMNVSIDCRFHINLYDQWQTKKNYCRYFDTQSSYMEKMVFKVWKSNGSDTLMPHSKLKDSFFLYEMIEKTRSIFVWYLIILQLILW
jgi:hypothetical protein